MDSLLQAYLPPEFADVVTDLHELPAEVRAFMAAQLRRELASYTAYIPSRLVRSQLRRPAPGRVSGAFWQGTLLFADLSGFTMLCERLSALGKQGAEEVSTVINQLFNTLVAEIFTYQGDVLTYRGELLKFGGDALTAFFDAQTLGPSHVVAAIHAALAMQERMEAFAALETRGGIFRLQLRIGVHSGRVFAAEVGDHDHIELVITGPDVNRVAKAQEYAAPGEVVITEQTAALLEEVAEPPTLSSKRAGFFQIQNLPTTSLSVPSASTIFPGTEEHPESNVSAETLEMLARQVTALRPYLIQGLPRRFLDATEAEVGEFRPVSFLFANFYNFSDMLTMLGDDALRAATALNAYYQRAQNVVRSYGGVINKVDMYPHGDKLVALFGAPVAHEDDPLRAVQCAFDLETALQEANADIATMLKVDYNYQPVTRTSTHSSPFVLRQRIGINTGTVFAGRVGGARRYEYTVMGVAVNLAARLMESASEGTILLSPETHAAVERHIATTEQPPIQVKGISHPVIPFVAVRDRRPLQVAKSSLIAPPLIGRDTELTLMLNEARAAFQGKGRMLVLVGEAGFGKTRLLEEFTRRMVLSSVTSDSTNPVPHFQIYMGEGQSLKKNVPYIALRPPLRHILISTMNESDGGHEWSKSELDRRVRHRVEQLAPELSHFMPLLGDVLGIPLDETPLTTALKAEQRHHRTQELVVSLLLSAAAQEPLLLVIDDLQWADTTSLELLERLSHYSANVPLFVILSYRANSTIREPWLDIPNTTYLTLTELKTAERNTMLKAILGSEPPLEILPLLARTQGNPFFIEELVRTLVTSRTLIQDKSKRWCLVASPSHVTLPSSIEGMIMARLDQLDEPFHELVQVASVIGHRFQYQILAGVYRYPEILAEGLQQLIDTDLIRPEEPSEQKSADRTYLFRHALLHDVAYEGILYATRRDLHRRVAQRIEEVSNGQTDEHLALLTRHYLLAEEWEPAFRYNMEAGIQAKRRYANQEALAYFSTALDIAPRLERSITNRRVGTFDRRVGPPDRRTTHTPYPSERDRRVGPPDRRSGLVDRRGKNPERQLRENRLEPSLVQLQVIEAHEHQGDIFILMGAYDQAEATYHKALKLVEQCKQKYADWKKEYTARNKRVPAPSTFEPRLRQATVRLYRLMAEVLEHHANYDAALEWIERGMALATPDLRDELARYYMLGASIYQHEGNFDKSLEWAQQGLEVAEELGSTSDQAHALMLMGNLWRDRGEFALSIPALEKARKLLDQMKDANRLGNVLKSLGDAYWRMSRWQDALKCYHQSLQISENIGDVLGMAHTSNNMAGVMVGRGELQLAAELYKYSSEQFRRIGSLLGLAITGYNNGEVLMLQGHPRDALHLLLASISSLERLKARNFLAEAMRLAAEANLLLGDLEQAQTYIARSLELAHELGMVVEEAIALRVMAQIAVAHNDFPTARTHLVRSRTMLENLDNRYDLAQVLTHQARLEFAEQRFEQVMPLLHQAEEIFKKLQAKRDLALLKEFIAEVEESGSIPLEHIERRYA